MSENRKLPTIDRRSNRVGERGSVNRIAIAYRPVDQLKPNPKNPRQHSPKQLRQIEHSIKKFGFVGAIVIDAERNVVIGHARLLAARQLGFRELPTIELRHLSPAQLTALMIADNKLAESTWDDQLLAEHLKELSELDLDFNLEVTGFEVAEIDLRIQSLTAEPENEDDPADVLPPKTSRPPVSQDGDLWVLGRHRVYCGSALEARAYEVLMDGERAEMIFADPPYNVPIEGHASGLGAIHHREFAMASGEMTNAEFTAFLTLACTLLARHSIDGALHFLCIDWRHMSELLAAGKKAYTELKNVCVWVKHNAGMGSFYRGQHEFIFVFKHGRGPHRNNVELGRHGRHRSNVWNYRSANSFGGTTDEGNLLALHPTVKPVALVADAILDCSARGDVVLDGFLGSGTTVIAAERMGRRCYGIEIDPLYCDTIIRRWQAFTGDSARHAVTGRSFDEVETETEARHGE